MTFETVKEDIELVDSIVKVLSGKSNTKLVTDVGIVNSKRTIIETKSRFVVD